MVLCQPPRQGSDQLGSDFAPGVADGDRVAKHTSLTSLMCWAVSMTLLALNSLQHFEQNWCLNHNEMSLLPKIGNQPLVKSPVVVRSQMAGVSPIFFVNRHRRRGNERVGLSVVLSAAFCTRVNAVRNVSPSAIDVYQLWSPT